MVFLFISQYKIHQRACSYTVLPQLYGVWRNAAVLSSTWCFLHLRHFNHCYVRKKVLAKTPFVFLAVIQRQPVRVNYKVLQLFQSGRRGEHVDTDFVPTEIWPDWISLDAHRLSKIYNSFNPFTEKEALAPGCRIYILFLGGVGRETGPWGRGVLSALAIQVHKICLCVCVCGGGGGGHVWFVCRWLCKCKGVGVSLSVYVGFTLRCMTKYE